jgi:type IX secretion system PorP/SprF family membrane protein
MRSFLILFFLVVSVHAVRSQDVIFSQNFLVPETLNTSFTGALRSSKMGTVHRSQWRNLNFKTNSSFVFFDTWLEGYKTGLGISFLNQTESASTYTFNQLNFNYSMAFQISHSWYFRPSISVGFGMKNYGFQNLLLEDQINVNSSIINTSTIDPLLLRSSRNFFDFSSSLLFNNEDSWIGLTVKHLNKPNISLTDNGNVPLDIFISAHSNILIPVFNNYRNDFIGMSKLFLITNFMIQGPFNRLDVGAQYVIDDRFSMGVLASTSPIKNTDQSSLISSVTAFAGIRLNGLRFGYSYDVNTTQLLNTGGIHEFSISYDFIVNIRRLERYKCVPFF